MIETIPRRAKSSSSTFDEPARRHRHVAEMVHRAKAKRQGGGGPRCRRSCWIPSPASPGPTTRWLRSRGGFSPGGVDANALAHPEALLRLGPQPAVGRLAHDHRHRPDRDGQPDGRGDLRGVQGHGEHGAGPGPRDRRPANLSGHRSQPLRNAAGGAPPDRDGTEPGLSCCATSLATDAPPEAIAVPHGAHGRYRTNAEFLRRWRRACSGRKASEPGSGEAPGRQGSAGWRVDRPGQASRVRVAVARVHHQAARPRRSCGPRGR